jgi:predicted P-loop ATPase
MEVSIFKGFNIIVEDLALPVIMEQIRDGRFRAEIETLRTLLEKGDLSAYKEEKKKLLAFTPSGRFEGGRKLEYLQRYSQYLILDIDDLSYDKAVVLKKLASEIPYTYACFISPSREGLKILVKVDSKAIFHKLAFLQVQEYYEKHLKVKIDPSGKDIPRLCFYSYDKDLFLSTYSETFNTLIAMIEKDIEKVVQQIEANRIDLTANYKDWISICFALIDALGDGAREHFHRVSKFHPAYKPTECDEQFDKCLGSKKSGVTAKSFFFFARDYGIDISPVTSIDLSEHKSNDNSDDTAKPKSKKKKRNNNIDAIEAFLNARYTMRFNVVTANLEVKKVNKTNYVPITDYIENSMLRELLKNNLSCSISKLRNILFSDFCKKYDPFLEYFSSLPQWDGEIDYILQLSKTVSTTNDELWHYCFKKWLVAIVASVLEKEIVNQTAIIFSGAQGIGKTTWMVNLCPASLKNYLFSGTINPTNKDTLVHLSECWLINMDELENMNRTEIGTLKEIITNPSIRLRRAYGHNSESLTRRASFMGSVNTSQFLNDTTGSRRFLCFEVTAIDYKHAVNLENVYAQAFSLFSQGFIFWFEKSDIATISLNNEQYQIRTSEEELLLTYFEPVPLSEAITFFTASQILAKIANFAKVNITTGSVISIGRALKKHGFEKTKKGGIYVWAVKEITFNEAEDNARKH